MTKKWIEPFEIDGLSPKEIIEKIAATYMTILADAYAEGYTNGHKDGMAEEVTTITE